MQTHVDLLSVIRKRLDDLVVVHTAALVAAPSTAHDRIAGKIEALASFRKDLAQVSREFQAQEVIDSDDERMTVINPSPSRGPARPVTNADDIRMSRVRR